MPVVDAIEATRQLLADPVTAAIRILIVTTFDLDEYVFAALKAGASGFLLKDTPHKQLLDGIRTVAAGDALLGPSVTRRLIRDFVNRPVEPPTARASVAGAAGLDHLTVREREILTLVATGRSNRDIAAQLTISVATVKTHVSRLLSKLDAHDRAELVVIAYEARIVEQVRGS